MKDCKRCNKCAANSVCGIGIQPGAAECETFNKLVEEKNTSENEKKLLATLHDVISQACGGADRELDSMAMTAYASGMLLLAEYGVIKITAQGGRRIIAEQITGEKTT